MRALQRRVDRRTFIRVSALAGGGLLVACGGGRSGGTGSLAAVAPNNAGDPPPDPVPEGDNFQPHAFIKIAQNNVITIIVGPTEVGQGILTTIAQIVADELDADWAKVTWEQAPPDPKYRNPLAGQSQLTAASFSVRGLWDVLTKSGAAIRQLLIEAAAEVFGVSDLSTLRTADSFVIHDATVRQISYGQLASRLGEQDPAFDPQTYPQEVDVATKTPGSYRLIGQSLQRLDGPEKADGSPIFGLDMEAEDIGLDTPLKVVVVARPPRFGANLVSIDDSTGATALGAEVHQLSNSVAVVADDFWTAERARAALQLTWDESSAEKLNSSDLPAQYNLVNAAPGVVIRNDGFVPPGGATLTEDYFFPFLGHAPLEPLNVIIDYRGSTAELWMGSQWPDLHQRLAATRLGLPVNAVTFNTLLAGGGFGRRANVYGDLVVEACEVALAVRQPLKVVWAREDDIRGGYYRPATACRMEAFIENGALARWGHRVTSQAVFVNDAVEAAFRGAGGAGDEFVVTGLEPEVQTTQGAVELPYDIAHVRVDQHNVTNQVPLLWVRSVANSTNVYAVETFFDLVASQLGTDPYALRRQLLQSDTNKRHLAVVERVAEAIGWETHSGNTALGMAVFNSYDSVLCTAMEVRVTNRTDGRKNVAIERVVSAVDVGIAVNPDLLIAQIESGIVFGLSTIMFGEITFKDGHVQQSNYDDFRVMRMFECPPMETIVIESDEHPGGAGELGVPCAGPALANAIYAATGDMHTVLPLIHHGLVFE